MPKQPLRFTPPPVAPYRGYQVTTYILDYEPIVRAVLLAHEGTLHSEPSERGQENQLAVNLLHLKGMPGELYAYNVFGPWGNTPDGLPILARVDIQPAPAESPELRGAISIYPPEA